MGCWFHKWRVIYRGEPRPNHWFEDRECIKCGEQEIIDGCPFFGSLDDAITLGAAMGIYKALGSGKLEKMVDSAIKDKLKRSNA